MPRRFHLCAVHQRQATSEATYPTTAAAEAMMRSPDISAGAASEASQANQSLTPAPR